jgi:hypothetical protein
MEGLIVRDLFVCLSHYSQLRGPKSGNGMLGVYIIHLAVGFRDLLGPFISSQITWVNSRTASIHMRSFTIQDYDECKLLQCIYPKQPATDKSGTVHRHFTRGIQTSPHTSYAQINTADPLLRS